VRIVTRAVRPVVARVRIWNILVIKNHYFLENLLIFLHTILQDAQFNHQELPSDYFNLKNAFRGEQDIQSTAGKVP
jgi:hypothetical protein